MDEFEKILRKSSGSMKKWGLLEDGDYVLIGLSGGKDSLALVEVMAARQKIFVPRINVMACHVGVKNVPYKSDIDYLRHFCEERGVEFIYKETEFELDRHDGRSPCFLCSWTRRKMLFRTAGELGCNKLALGHHKDDIVETLLLNEIFTGRIETMMPRMEMRKFNLTVIRPLCDVREKEISEMAKAHQYRQQIKNCPYEDDGNRRKVKNLVRELEEWNPDVVSSLYGSMFRHGKGDMEEND